MVDAPVQPERQDTDGLQQPAGRGFMPKALVISGSFVALALALGWSERLTIADRLIAGQLASLHLPARYRIVEMGPTHAVLADVVVGPAVHPDFTAARIVIDAGFSGFLPGIKSVRVEQPRLHGTWQGGRLSLGALDPLWQGPSTAPFRLPNIDLTVVDARASLTGEHGPIGMAITGHGSLRGGFTGPLAVVAPHLAAGGCKANASFSGGLTMSGESPKLNGPLDLAAVACQNGALKLAKARVGVTATLAPALDGGEAEVALETGAASYAGTQLAKLTGPLKLSLRNGSANAVWNLAAENLQSQGVAAQRLGLSGRLRAPSKAGGADFARIDGEGVLTGQALAPDAATFAQIARAQSAAAGTLAAPLIAQIAANLRRESAGSHLDGHFTFHAADGSFSAVMPELHWRGESRNALLEAKRLTLVAAKGKPAQLSGSFTSATPGLPQLDVGIEQGGAALRIKMADYRMIGPTRAGDASMTLPQLLLTREGQGWRWRGAAQVSGALADGVRVAGLAVPLDGRMNAQGEIALWQACTPLRFDRLDAAALTLDRVSLSLCPTGRAVLTTGIGGPRIAARLAALDLAGRMGESPLKITSGPLDFALASHAPAALSGKAVAITLGQGADASHFHLAALTAKLSGHSEGQFTGLDAALAPVPADIKGANGTWRYADGVLSLGQMALRVVDRSQVPRFSPLIARAATLSLAKGVVQADATLREPVSDRPIVRIAIAHELASAKGHADLALDALTFDKALQPDRLSAMVQGTIANAQGRFDGTGRIDWASGKDGSKLTSHARVTTQGFSFAGMVGPVKNVAGTVEFTDLLGLVTAPHQRLTIGSINPGIEANNGILRFSMEPNFMLVVDGASWPFMDGTMEMSPARLQLGGAAVRRFEMRLTGVNAAKFITQMEVNNLTASGTFDGRVPLVFDQNGGRVAGGELVSRPPGGSVSYVGELSYRDLSPMANYAFRALKALKFSQMRVGLDGDLAGEVVTRVSMDGLAQGEGTTKNFLTKQIARIPMQFNVNVHAPFYQMFGSLRSLYDTTFVGDPREKGLTIPLPTPAPVPKKPIPIQPPVSEHRP